MLTQLLLHAKHLYRHFYGSVIGAILLVAALFLTMPNMGAVPLLQMLFWCSWLGAFMLYARFLGVYTAAFRANLVRSNWEV